MAMADRGTIGVPLPLRADGPLDLLLEQLHKHPEPDLDRQSQQPLPRSPHKLAQRLLHPLGQHGLITGRLRDRYGLTHGGSSFGLGRSTRHAPTTSGRAGGTAVTSNFYAPWGNLLVGGVIALDGQRASRRRRAEYRLARKRIVASRFGCVCRESVSFLGDLEAVRVGGLCAVEGIRSRA